MVLIINGKLVGSQHLLANAVQVNCRKGFVFCPAERGEEHPRQYGVNGDDYQQLDEGKTEQPLGKIGTT
jgi:hypothetical protein